MHNARRSAGIKGGDGPRPNTMVRNSPITHLAVFVTLFAAAPARSDDAPTQVSFRNDVMAVLSKAGCNAGACHGNKSGKGGFKLSLRGESPGDDFNALTRELFGRRANVLEPDKSLILLKATAQLQHEGGKRFGKDSPEYRTFRAWLAAGARRDDAGVPVLRS